MYNLEDISLKIIRILYQLSQKKATQKVTLNALEDRFSFTDRKQGHSLLIESLQSLESLSLISKSKDPKNIAYQITPKGKQFYKNFKHLTENVPTPKNNIVIEGNWTGNNNNYINMPHQQNEHEQFPGASIEFLDHYEELMKEVEQLNTLINKQHKKQDILEHITNIKNILNSNIEKINQQFPWAAKLEQLSERIENQLHTLNQYLQKHMTY